jgi:LytTr DNA-binding domain
MGTPLASWTPRIQQTAQAGASNCSPTGEWVRGRANRHYNGLMNEARRSDFWRDWAVDLAIASACAVFFGLIGPFGSYMNGPAWQRVVFQLACFLPGTLLFGSLVRVVLRLRLRPVMTWMSIVLGVAILNAPFQIWVVSIAISIWPFLKFLRPLDWYLQGLITALPIVLGFTLLMQARHHRREQAKEAGEAPPTAFGLLGAPPSAVLCLQMEDHYVRVHTAGHSRLVLATLNQAMTALENTEGLQVHRSWWVARKAVARAATEGRNLRLQLVNGLTAPVARSAVAAVREAGWLTNENPAGGEPALKLDQIGSK